MKKLLCCTLLLLGLSACTDYKPMLKSNGIEAKIQPINISELKPIEYSPMFYNVIEGSPKHKLWKLEEDGKTSSGVWQSSKGKWRFENDHWEYCRIRKGISIITEDGGEPIIVKAGDSFILRRGFKGTWEVVEETQKDYVIQK